MGQKVNPVGMRIGVNRDWNSRWYADDKEYPVYLNEDIKIRKYLEGSLKEAMLSHIEIERLIKEQALLLKYLSHVQVLSSDKTVKTSTLLKKN